MHPAPSVILFTTLSGLGFGLLAFLGIGQPPVTGWVAFVFYVIAYGLAVGGLLASTFHLGNRKNAIKAFSQWRTSWLSREAWLSVFALVAMGIYAAGAVFASVLILPIGIIGAALSVATVYSTSMIYAQLKTVPRWNQPLTPVLFLSLSLAGGAMLAGATMVAIPLLALAGVIQLAWWWQGDRRFAEAGSTLATATGLGAIGTPRQFEPPHTGTNYLMKEMVFVVGRKHARKLRTIAFAAMIVFPVLMLLVSGGHLAAGLAILSHLAGTLISRWLYFAEAEHVVGLYYGAR